MSPPSPRKAAGSLLVLCALALVAGAAGFALPPFQLEEVVRQARAFAERAPPPPPAGNFTRRSYLELAAGIVEAFQPFQDTTPGSPRFGRIIDPYAKEEIQYSTPCFAHAGARLLSAGYYPDQAKAGRLLTAVSRAMDAALQALVFGQPNGTQGCAQGHCNFYTMPLMFALEALAADGIAPVADVQRWRGLALQIEPTRAYKGWPHAEGNWAVVALTGEYLRLTLGLRPGNATADIVEQLAHQYAEGDWTSNGQYQDRSGCDGRCNPLPYDHFPRKYLAVMLARGYALANASDYWALVERGAWASLLLQGPGGELPTGARSSQHQWNEAVSCVTFELFAARSAAAGDAAGAALFRRAAALSVAALRRWVRPDGALWVVKNRVDPARRHGYEGYSYFSQYNLLPASMLATAYLFAPDGPPPAAASIAETGGFVAVPESMHKVIAGAGGMYVEVELYPDTPTHDVLGLARVHRRGVEPLVGYTAGAPLQPEGASNAHAAGLGLAWRAAGANATAWERLAQVPFAGVSTAVAVAPGADPARAAFSVLYNVTTAAGEALAVNESYVVTPAAVTVVVTAAGGGDLAELAVAFPAFVTDGARNGTAVVPSGQTLCVQMHGDATSGFGLTGFSVAVQAPAPVRLDADDALTYSRNGFVREFRAIWPAAAGRTATYVLTPEPEGCPK